MGTPILLLAYNRDMRPQDYEELKTICRPSHADFTYLAKYGMRDFRGSGRASARETLARVAAGAIAKKYLQQHLNIEIISFVEQVGPLQASIDHRQVTPEAIEASAIRCPDPSMARQMIEFIEQVKSEGDSIGGIIKGVIRNAPAGLGEPVFDKLSADLGKAMLSINAVKGFDIGSGFACALMRGSEHNELLANHAGGVLGGISSGEDIYFRVAFKPVGTIAKTLPLKTAGRHDPCVLPRAVPIVDAMAALVMMDHYLRFFRSDSPPR